MANLFTFSSMNVWGDKESSSRNVISSRRRKRIWMKKYGWIPLFKQDFLLYFEESSSSCMQKLHLCKLRDINLLALETIFIGILAPSMEKEQFKTFNLLTQSSNEGELIFDSIFFFVKSSFKMESVENCLFHLIPLFLAPFLLTAIIKLFTNNEMHYHDLAKYSKKSVQAIFYLHGLVNFHNEP